MFSRTIWIAFLTVALSTFTAQAAPTFQDSRQQEGCSSALVRTVTETVTVTAGAIGTTTLKEGGSGSKTTAVAATGSAKHHHHTHTGSGSHATTTAKGATNTGTAGKGKNTGTSTASASKSTSTAGGGNNVAVSTNSSSSDAQTSLTLDPRVLASGFANNGQDVAEAGQVPSLTSTNNFINFCLTVPNLPITNGKQITTGSCNPAPIGTIPSTDNMPSAKFAFPQNFGTIKANTAFTIKMNIQNLETGNFVNAQENYFAAPQQLNAQGQIVGHSHVVVEQLDSLDQATPTDPRKFAFFKGLNAAAVGGVLTADVTNGLPAGFYRLASINTAANHQPAIVPVAQHGALDDAIYFTVTEDGNPDNSTSTTTDASATASADSSTADASATATATDSAAATGSASVTATATADASATATEATSTASATAKDKGNGESSSVVASETASATQKATGSAAAAAATATESTGHGRHGSGRN